MANKMRNDDFIKKLKEKNINYNNFKILSDYNGKYTMMNVKCLLCNNTFTVRADHLLNIYACPKCTQEHKSKKMMMSNDEFIKRIDKSKNLVLLSEYKGARVPIKVMHKDCGRIFYTSPQCIGRGSGCPYCNSISNINKKRTLSHDEFQKKCANFTLIDKYEGNRTFIRVKCNKCGNIKYVKAQSVPNLSCNICNRGTSLAELEIYDYIKSIYSGEIIKNSRNIINNMEIDIYIPEFKLGIEYDSFYYHNSNVVDNNYHLKKTEECNSHGIKLIHIFEDEWRDKKEIVKSKIKYELNLVTNKIYARKCTIKEIDSKSKNIFLDKNHIQGRDKSMIYLGLFYNNNLVSVMTISRPRVIYRNKDCDFYELSRFASDINYNVIGAFSKLLSYLLNKYTINRLVSYIDLRYSNLDNQYKDFKYVGKSKPNYWYILGNKRYHRFNFAKHTLKNKFPEIYSSDKSEKEIMHEAGALCVYDCGNAKYELCLKDKI